MVEYIKKNCKDINECYILNERMVQTFLTLFELDKDKFKDEYVNIITEALCNCKHYIIYRVELILLNDFQHMLNTILKRYDSLDLYYRPISYYINLYNIKKNKMSINGN